MRALLNVLVALLDRQHVARDAAHALLSENLAHGWASCPLTQNGVIRILTNPHYLAPVSAAAVLAKIDTSRPVGITSSGQTTSRSPIPICLTEIA